MALKRTDDNMENSKEESLIKETKILTTFSIEPSFKSELQEMFSDMGLGWSVGIRFALKDFLKNHKK